MKIKAMVYVLFAGTFLFSAATGVAWGESCDLTSCETDSGWSIELLGGYPQLITPCDSIFPDPDDAEKYLDLTECYEWKYQVYNGDVGDTVGLTQLLLTIPAPCGDPPLFKGGEANPTLYPPGAGDTTSNFGKDIKSIAVARFEPNNTDGVFSFYSPDNTITEATVAVAVKKGDGSCLIGGPSHYCYDEPEDILTLSSTEFVSTYDDNTQKTQLFRIKRNQDTKCITEVIECISDDCLNYRLLDDVSIEEAITVNNVVDGEPVSSPGQWSGGTNQKCNEAILKSVGDKTWVWISGRRVWR